MFAVPEELSVTEMYASDTFRYHKLAFNQEEYLRRVTGYYSYTRVYNKIAKVLVFYVLKGYRLNGLDFSVLITDLYHDVPWEFESLETRSLYLSPLEIKRCSVERNAVEIGLTDITPEVVVYGPAFSKEFEKSFDNLPT